MKFTHPARICTEIRAATSATHVGSGRGPGKVCLEARAAVPGIGSCYQWGGLFNPREIRPRLGPRGKDSAPLPAQRQLPPFRRKLRIGWGGQGPLRTPRLGLEGHKAETPRCPAWQRVSPRSGGLGPDPKGGVRSVGLPLSRWQTPLDFLAPNRFPGGVVGPNRLHFPQNATPSPAPTRHCLGRPRGDGKKHCQRLLEPRWWNFPPHERAEKRLLDRILHVALLLP